VKEKKRNREVGRKWDGISRPTSDLYKKNYDDIFKKEKEEDHGRSADDDFDEAR
jgi:hypothetical protein